MRLRLRRAGRRTNVALLVLVAAAFVTGWAAFAAGTPGPARVATVAHGLFGLGLLLLVPWKQVVIRRAPRVHAGSVALVGLVLICLTAGVVEVFVGYRLFAGLVSPIQVHVTAAVAVVVLMVTHVRRHRGQRVRRVDVSRRNLLRTGGFVAAAGALWVTAEAVGRAAGSASGRRLATGSHALPAADIPATIWLLDAVPELDAASHRVAVAGRSWSAAELAALAGPVRARLDCTSGWYADALWTAVPVSALLDAPALAAAASIEVTSVTGYSRRFPVAEASALYLATGVEGRVLDAGTGAPVRLVAPGRRGFWWVKWVASVRLSQLPAYAQSPFPLQ